MAKYTINYACGHTQEIELFGSHKEREERIKYLQENDCPECRKEKEYIYALSQSASLPKLEGTEKQVRWAMVIRQKWIDRQKKNISIKGIDFDEYVKRLLADYEEKKNMYEAHEERKNPCLDSWKFLTALIETSAAFFIDHR